MRSRYITAAVVIALPLTAFAGASVAHAETVSVSSTPNLLCSDWKRASNSMVYSGASAYSGMDCGYVDELATVSLDKGTSKSWTFQGPGDAAGRYWRNLDYCAKSVNASYTTQGKEGAGGGDVFQFNVTGKADSAQFSAGVFWATTLASDLDNQYVGKVSAYDKECQDDFSAPQIAALFPVSMTMTGDTSGSVGSSSAFTVTVDGSTYGGQAPATGTVELRTKSSGKTVVLATADLANGQAELVTDFSDLAGGTYDVYAAYLGTASKSPTVPSSGWGPSSTDSISVTVSGSGSTTSAEVAAVAVESARLVKASARASDLGLTVAEKRTSVGGKLNAVCPAGNIPTQINLLSASRKVDMGDLEVRTSGRTGASLQAPDGKFTALQVLCRPVSAGVSNSDGVAYGSASADRLATTASGVRSVFGGLGDDTIRLRAANSSAWGGLGDDSLIAKAKGAAASGGFGDDVLRSTTSKSTLLNGGPGNDTFYGGAGKTLINAKDGQRGDVVYCGSKKNVVLADKGDTIVGPCTLEG